MGKDMLIVEMKKHFEVRAIEWWSAGTLLSWGLVVLLLPDLFHQPRYLAMFSSMLNWAPQQVWGLFAFTMGFMRLGALFVNGFWFRTPQIRLMTSFLSVCVWFFITAGLARSGTYLGVAIYGWHMIADIYSSFRSAADVVEAEARKKLQSLNPPGAEEPSNVRRITGR
jgi:hypothetical protein